MYTALMTNTQCNDFIKRKIAENGSRFVTIIARKKNGELMKLTTSAAWTKAPGPFRQVTAAGAEAARTRAERYPNLVAMRSSQAYHKALADGLTRDEAYNACYRSFYLDKVEALVENGNYHKLRQPRGEISFV